MTNKPVKISEEPKITGLKCSKTWPTNMDRCLLCGWVRNRWSSYLILTLDEKCSVRMTLLADRAMIYLVSWTMTLLVNLT